MVAKERYYKYKVRKKQAFEYGRLRYDGAEDDEKDTRQRIEQETEIEWNQRWLSTENGAITKRYFSTVASGIGRIWLRPPDYYTSQFLTGHGDFAAKLNSMKLVEQSTCRCGELQTSSTY